MGGNGARSRTAAGGGGVVGVAGRGVAAGGGGVNMFGAMGLGSNLVTGQKVMPRNANDHDPNWAHMTQAENRQLQQRMGQTGFEAGRMGRQGVTPSQKMYVATSKSFNINKFLYTDGKDPVLTERDPKTGRPLSDWLYKDSQGNIHGRNGFSLERLKETIRTMDAGMKPLPRAINTTRVEGSNMALSTFGLGNYKMSDIMKMDQSSLDALFTGKIRYNKAYTSMAFNEDGIKFGYRSDVCIEYTLPQGTKVIQTNNIAEHETILGRGYAQKCTSARIGNAFGKKMLILTVSVIPQDQSAWFKV